MAAAVPDAAGAGVADRRVRGRPLGGVAAAAWAGWWFGFGYFLAGLYWVGHAFLVDAKTFGWLLPFAIITIARRAGAVHGVRHRAGAAVVVARRDAGDRTGGGPHPGRVVARTPAHRISVEHVRLCAGDAIGARADRLPDRNLGTHLPRGRGLRGAGGLGRRSRRHAPPLAGTRARRCRDRRARRLRRVAARPHADDLGRRRAAAADAAEPAAGSALQLFATAGGDGALRAPCPTVPADRTHPASATLRI